MLPFDEYPGNGRQLLGKPSSGDGTCRHGYGPPIFELSGTTCVYCGRDLKSSYESWLDISVDHVIPLSVSADWSRQRNDWIWDKANMVTCCRACNEFFNRHKVNDPLPRDISEFFDLRDRVFREKQERARQRHGKECLRYKEWLTNEEKKRADC